MFQENNLFFALAFVQGKDLTYIFFFYFWAVPQSRQDLRSWTRDQTHALWNRSLNHWPAKEGPLFSGLSIRSSFRTFPSLLTPSGKSLAHHLYWNLFCCMCPVICTLCVFQMAFSLGLHSQIPTQIPPSPRKAFYGHSYQNYFVDSSFHSFTRHILGINNALGSVLGTRAVL